MKTLPLSIHAILLVACVATVHADERATTQPLPPSLTIEGRVRIELSTADNRAALVSLRDGEKTEWAGPRVPKAALWKLALRGPQRATAELAGGDLPLADARSDGRSAILTWKPRVGDGLAEVMLRVSTDNDSALSRWHLSAVLPDGWKVARADWPILPSIRVTPGLKMAAPFGWGVEYDVKPGMSYEGTYPSLIASMPFVAFYTDRKGLYVGAHDKEGHHKYLAVKARQDGAGVVFTHWPADADTVGGRYSPAFHVAVGVFDGDSWDAARIYRAFTRETTWGGAGAGLRLTSSDRPVPDWLRDIDLWLIPGAEPLKNVETCREAREFFGVPIALHWYAWHAIPFDTLYPDYFPPKPNFREGVKALKDAGFRVMPYINGRLCDPKSKTWTDEGADKAAARQDDGQLYTEVYGSKVPLHVMCPATPQWRDKIAGIVDRLVNEYGVDGVYIDQIGAAHAVRCFNADHGHSPGGGTFWREGYSRMLDQIRAKLPKDRILTTEENAECWNDQFDALLMVNTPSTANRRIIPLMPAVYGGRMITFGFQYTGADDVRRSLPFRAKMAQAFLFGAQLGWIGVDAIMPADARKEAEFLRNLVQVRRGGHEFLLTGTFLGEMEVTGDNPRLTSEKTAGDGKHSIDLPAVMATAWATRDRLMGLAVVNLSDQPHTVNIRLRWDRLRELEGHEGSRPRASGAPMGAGQETLVITMPARDARIVRPGPTTRPR